MTSSANDGRVALVTGANQGIGWGIAQRLSREGYTVVVNGQRADAVAKAVADLQAAGGKASGAVANVADEQSVADMFQAIRSRHGRLDVLVNNAGIALRKDGGRVNVEDTPLDFWQRTLDVNLTGTFLVSRSAIPLMKERSWGRIINMASQVGRMKTGIGSGYYAASKAGIIGFSRVMAGELGPHGITVNCVCPGRIRTAMSASFANADEMDRRVAAITPLRKVGHPEDVAGAVAYLASDEAGFITGTIIDITGGYFMP